MIYVEVESYPNFAQIAGPSLARKFQEISEELGIIHEHISVKTSTLNAHIEAFHSILENECYNRYEFQSFMEYMLKYSGRSEC